jgi:hypothetical protein
MHYGNLEGGKAFKNGGEKFASHGKSVFSLFTLSSASLKFTIGTVDTIERGCQPSNKTKAIEFDKDDSNVTKPRFRHWSIWRLMNSTFQGKSDRDVELHGNNEEHHDANFFSLQRNEIVKSTLTEGMVLEEIYRMWESL